MQNSVGKSLYERPKPSILNLIINVILIIFFMIFVAEMVFNYYYTSIYVKGSSMVPTLTGAPNTLDGDAVLSGGDYVFVNTRVSPDYFDIVVVQTEDADGNSYDIIKRVIAFAGDTVRLDRGQLYILYNGDTEFTEIKEDYIASSQNSPEYSKNSGEWFVKEGMFLLGDNRNDSSDSRERGEFPLDSLVGVVPGWSIKYKSFITSIYTFFEFKLGFNRIGSKIYGD